MDIGYGGKKFPPNGHRMDTEWTPNGHQMGKNGIFRGNDRKSVETNWNVRGQDANFIGFYLDIIGHDVYIMGHNKKFNGT